MTPFVDLHLTRREVLQGSLLALGAGLGVAGCATKETMARGTAAGAVEPLAAGAFFSAEEMRELAEVGELILPRTDTPGARAANVHGFIDQLMAQWAGADTQRTVRSALQEIDSSARERFNRPFVELPPAQRVDVVAAVDAEAFDEAQREGKPRPSFARLKELILVGYYTSEIGATQELQFELIPGRYEGCVPLSQIGRAWAEEP